LRRPIIAANWKMHMTAAEAVDFADRFVPLCGGADDVEVVIAPPFTALDRLGQRLADAPIELAGQNVSAEQSGAFTGEIAAGMLVELGCSYAIVGHSERRALHGETDPLVARKAAALLRRQLKPIVCVGETLDHRDAGRALEVVGAQLRGSLAEVPVTEAEKVVIAYEPVWAIGTGRTATPEIAQEVHAFIRAQLLDLFAAAANTIRIQYGGSVKPETIYALMAQPDIDGALVGGASLDPEAFARIVHFRSQNAGGS
jgi:triosephosphate isomerase